MKKAIKNILLIMVMTVLCMAVAVTASAACTHEDINVFEFREPSGCIDGYEFGLCKKCGSEVSRTIPATGEHVWQELGNRDCTTECMDYSCIYCLTTKTETFEPGEHEWENYPDTSTFCSGRYFTLNCRNCYVIEEVYVPGTGDHEWYPDYEEGGSYSCTEGGDVCYWCRNCEADKWEYTAPIGSHLWDDYPTEDEIAGTCGVWTREFECERCGVYGNESFTGLKEHNICWRSNNDATCTEDGTKTAYCTDCDTYENEIVIEPDVGSAFGHDYNAWIDLSDISCTQDGISVRSCKRCALIDVEKEKAYGHADNDGDGKCDECKVILESSGTVTPDAPHTEHAYSEWVTEGTLSYRQCTECGHIEIKFVTADGDIEIEYPDQSEQPDCSFEVEAVEGEGFVLIEEKVAEGIGAEFEVLKAFDINLKNSEGVHVQPDGSVKVKLPLDWEKEGNYKVYRDNGDGTFTDMNAVRQGSHMVFDTDHFSVYIIVEETAASTPEAPENSTPEENKKEDNVFTFLTNFLNSILDFFRKLFGIA